MRYLHITKKNSATGHLKSLVSGASRYWFLLMPLLHSSHTLSAPMVKEYQFQVIASYPHSRQVFTQGLQYHNDLLYESSGLYGRSSVLIRSLDSTTPLKYRALDKTLFAEGLTLLGKKLFQLTWQAGRILIYNPTTLQPLGDITLKGEGWGLATNGKHLIVSNGTDQLQFVDATTGAILKTLSVSFAGQPLTKLNELEWIDGAIYANVWQTHWMVIIDPDNGEVIGKVNLSTLLPNKLRDASTDVLNGIAYDKKQKRLFVTGKNWPTLYHIELLPTATEKPSTHSQTSQ